MPEARRPRRGVASEETNKDKVNALAFGGRTPSTILISIRHYPPLATYFKTATEMPKAPSNRFQSSRAVLSTVLAPLGQSGSSSRRRERMGQTRLTQQSIATEGDVRTLLSGISQDVVNAVRASNQASEDHPMQDSTGDTIEDDNGDPDNVWQDESMPVDESFKYAMRDASDLLRVQGRVRQQKRAWKPRKEHEYAAWNEIMDAMTAGYLEWQHTNTNPSAPSNPSRRPSQSSPPSPSPPPTFPPSPSSSHANLSTPPAESREDLSAQTHPDVDSSSLVYEFDVFDIFTLESEASIQRAPTSLSPTLDMIAHGYIAKTPTRPQHAVSITTLELLYRLRQRKPSFSIEAFAKVVCDYYQMPYRSYLRSLFADTFEIYLRLVRNVEKQVMGLLGWDQPDWRPLNACRACCYKLQDEPALEFDRLICMDGNSSLKRAAMLADRVAADTRVLDDSTYFLSNEYVDQFRHEVAGKVSKAPAVKTRRSRDDDSDSGDDYDYDGDNGDGHQDLSNTRVEGDPTDGLREHVAQAKASTSNHSNSRADGVPDTSSSDPPFTQPQPAPSSTPSHQHGGEPPPRAGPSDTQSTSAPENPAASDAEPMTVEDAIRVKMLADCVRNWKAASSEDKKKMWAVFEEAGIFASACRHGFILWILDIIRSGELAKYPLAILSKILDRMGDRVLISYNIGCAMDTTVKRSSLGEKFLQKNHRFCVPAFHGYTHNHACQLLFHPNIIDGTGIEDLETLERIFSGSNQLATVIRYMSAYRRRLYVEAYFRQWDEDKCLNTGTFLLNNYIQALEIVKQEESLIDSFKYESITPEDIAQWAREERETFAKLGHESPEDVNAIAYVEALQDLDALEARRTQATSQFVSYHPQGETSSAYWQEASRTQKLETARRVANEKYDRVLLDVVALEVKMGISLADWWTPLHPEYRNAVKYMHERKYRRALIKLQKLVVQRLFELHKLNIAQTAYKMRTHIAKSLQVRCKAIKRAVDAYNTAAAALNPPRPPVDWSKVSSYQFIEEFTLLQDTSNGIREQRWAKPGVREIIKLYRRVEHARGELVRLNVEIRRLHTAIRDEEALFDRVASALDSSNPLRSALLCFTNRRRQINNHLLWRIRQIYALPGYTGTPEPGTRVGASPSTAPTTTTDPMPRADPQQTRLPTAEPHHHGSRRRRANTQETDVYDEESEDDVEDETRQDVSAVLGFIADL